MAPSTSPEAQKLLEALAAEHSIPELRRLAQEYASNQLSGTFLRAVVAPRDSGAGGVESYLSFHDLESGDRVRGPFLLPNLGDDAQRAVVEIDRRIREATAATPAPPTLS